MCIRGTNSIFKLINVAQCYQSASINKDILGTGEHKKTRASNNCFNKCFPIKIEKCFPIKIEYFKDI